MNQPFKTIPMISNTTSSLAATTKDTVENYLMLLGNQDATYLYRHIMDQVEKPLLQVMMEHTNGNQSRTASCLGINRATLRSKLKRHSLI